MFEKTFPLDHFDHLKSTFIMLNFQQKGKIAKNKKGQKNKKSAFRQRFANSAKKSRKGVGESRAFPPIYVSAESRQHSWS